MMTKQLVILEFHRAPKPESDLSNWLGRFRSALREDECRSAHVKDRANIHSRVQAMLEEFHEWIS
jgi:hypothetical protein